MIDGQKQREAFSAAERSLHLLERRAFTEAVAAAERAGHLDQVGAFEDLPQAVAQIVAHEEQGGGVPAEAWEALAVAVGPGPLRSHVADLSR